MSAITGLQPVGTYTANDSANLAELLRIIPDPDAPHGTGAVAGGGHLDEMSPGCAAQLRVEIAAFEAAGGVSGTYTMVTADDTANHVDINTVDDFTLAKTAVSIYRSGSLVTADAVITRQAAHTLRIADGSTYHLTAGDIVNWSARL